MVVIYLVLCGLVVLGTLLPFLPVQHWSVRVFDFAKVQLAALGLIVLAGGFLTDARPDFWWGCQASLIACVLYNVSILVQYTPFYKVKTPALQGEPGCEVALLSANVLQFNTAYHRFLSMVKDVQPDLVLTMETNEAWDTAMRPLEADYPYFCKVPLENTYGMHLYSKLEMTHQVHYFVADDLPSIEAEVRTPKGEVFTLFCVHPPPPSPTEEPAPRRQHGGGRG
jgi:endonuclease/exonuclease/phosphatase (EEP) superfamily protein YafD